MCVRVGVEERESEREGEREGGGGRVNITIMVGDFGVLLSVVGIILQRSRS